MNEWCEEHLSKEQKEKVYIASIKKGFNSNDYFEKIEDKYFGFFNHSNDGSMDPGLDVVTNEVIEEFDSYEEVD